MCHNEVTWDSKVSTRNKYQSTIIHNMRSLVTHSCRVVDKDGTERGIASSPFSHYTVGRNSVVIIVEGLSGGGWLGGRSDEGWGGVAKNKRWGRNTMRYHSGAGLRTLSEKFRAIKMLYRMNVYDSNAETEGPK